MNERQASTTKRGAFARRGTSGGRDASTTTTLVWLALFAGVVAMLGGSSRFDAVQIAALRPLAALFLIPALYYLDREKLASARALVWLLELTALWTALQLVPLPPAVWQALPGREVFAELDRMNGLGDIWRPIALVPMRGWNALAAMIVPAAALLLVLALSPSQRVLLTVIVGLGVADAGLGLLQILGPNGGPLYFYTHTNDGGAVGLFANENHSAVFSALVLVVIARLALSTAGGRSASIHGIALGAAFVLVLLAALVSGSRAGLGLTLGALLASAMMAWLGLRARKSGSAQNRWWRWIAARPGTVLSAGAVLIAAAILALFQYGNMPGLSAALTEDPLNDLRWETWPILREIMASQWLLGAGFGSFDALYLVYEPAELQGPAYFNQAHNDWAQLVIEGGVPAIVLLCALGWWLAGRVRSFLSSDPAALSICIFWSFLAFALAMASLFDYPLRTPLLQSVAVLLLCTLAFEAKATRA